MTNGRGFTKQARVAGLVATSGFHVLSITISLFHCISMIGTDFAIQKTILQSPDLKICDFLFLIINKY
jgi:hypothetical protein